MGHEYDDVELPFLNQCRAMGWQVQEGSKDDPGLTGRNSFKDVISEATLRDRLRAINPGPDGQPWLDNARLSEAVSAITRPGQRGLMEANQTVTELLLRGLTVEGLPGWDGGRGQTIRYIDWDDVGANSFTIANQFRVDCPPGHDVGKGFIIPDLVLLVNGIPVVVVEAKSPAIPEPLAEAVNQLRRYHNARKAALEVEENEGAPALFASVQLLIATSFDQARVGCIGAGLEHYGSWKTVVGPDGTGSEDAVAAALGKKGLSEQERLIAGMLRPAHLLDILRHYLLFMNVGGQTIKTVCRYQQYRAVNRALERLRTGKTRAQDGEYDRRGGIVWHTQGSGKSLTMVFMIRKMRTDAALRKFKVIMVTDRRDLQRQLSETATLSGDVVELATNAGALKRLARRKGPGLVFATIQKYRTEEDVAEVAKGPVFEVLNEDETILVVVDEAHRTQAGDLHANLMAALPNCARIGFTGTPIIMGEKKRTAQIFGDFIDRYTIKEAEADGATVPVLYEGRTAEGAVKDGATLDGLFEDMFRGRTEDELEAIRKKYATKVADHQLVEFVEEKLLWVHTKIEEKARLQQRAPIKEFVDGEGFLYLGKSYRLRLVENQLVDLSLRNGRFCLRKASVLRGREILVSWYTRRAQDWFERQVTEQANRMGVTVKEVNVQDLGYRWGSFGSGGRVSFHWKAILLPPRIAQYVVIHELAHGLYPDHSVNFWIKVEQHLPDWRWRKSWLAENGIQVEGL